MFVLFSVVDVVVVEAVGAAVLACVAVVEDVPVVVEVDVELVVADVAAAGALAGAALAGVVPVVEVVCVVVVVPEGAVVVVVDVVLTAGVLDSAAPAAAIDGDITPKLHAMMSSPFPKYLRTIRTPSKSGAVTS